MRIAFVVPSLGPSEGQGRANLAMVRAVAAAGHQVDVFAGNVPPEVHDLARVRALPRLPAWQFGNQLLALAATRAWIKRDRYDLIHADAATTAAGADVIVCHTVTACWLDLPDAVWRAPGARGLNEAIATRFKARLEIAQAKAARAVVANSPRTADDLAARGVSRDAITVVPFGVDPDRFAPASEADRAAARAAFGIDDGAFVVAFVGPLGRRKGFDVAVRATRGMDVTLLAAGDHREPALLRDAPHVVAPGKVADVRGVYAAADVFAYPSAYDGFGMAVLEAMASGLPVIVSKHAGSSALVADAGFIVDPSEADGLRDAIASLQVHADRRRALGARGRAIAEDSSWDETGATLLKVYERAAGIAG